MDTAALRRLLARTALKESFLVTIANVVYVVLILNLMGLVAVRMGVPNSKIINDIVQNYNYTSTRQIKLRLELEGIQLVPPQVGVQSFDKGMRSAIPDRSMG